VTPSMDKLASIAVTAQLVIDAVCQLQLEEYVPLEAAIQLAVRQSLRSFQPHRNYMQIALAERLRIAQHVLEQTGRGLAHIHQNPALATYIAAGDWEGLFASSPCAA
jgi:hypothetical protein